MKSAKAENVFTISYPKILKIFCWMWNLTRIDAFILHLTGNTWSSADLLRFRYTLAIGIAGGVTWYRVYLYTFILL